MKTPTTTEHAAALGRISPETFAERAQAIARTSTFSGRPALKACQSPFPALRPRLPVDGHGNAHGGPLRIG